MHEAARGLASLGRYGDDTLLHVSRKELQGLRALTGKDFTRNPETGLPEAFSWTSLIPVAAGIAGTVLSGGNPVVGALASGAASTAVGAAEGKSTQQALTQGLISGVTSYAGGQLLQGVGAGAGEVAGEGFGQVATAGPAVTAPSVASMTPEAAMASLPSAPTEFTTGVSGLGASTSGVPSGDIVGPVGPAQTYGAVGDVGPKPPTFGENLGQRVSAAGDRISNIVTEPKQALDQIAANVKNRPYDALIAAGGTYAQAMDALAPEPYEYKDTYDPSKYPEQFPGSPRSWNAPPAGYQAGAGPEYRYFAKGGLADLKSGDRGMTANIVNEAKAALLDEHPRPKEAIDRFRNMFGEDAFSLLRDRVAGGRVRGAGGGMDDLIPGTIEGRQQVRLADGEFVLPADVVSGLGDGSTDQGVRRLKEMMTKVRQERTGKKAQPKAVGGKITL